MLLKYKHTIYSMEKINNRIDSISNSFKNAKSITNVNFEALKNNSKMGLYANIVLFFILSIVALNDLQKDPGNDNNPYKRKEKEVAKTAISNIATLLVLVYVLTYIYTLSAPNWSNYYYLAISLMGFAYIYITLSYNRLFNYSMSILLILIVLVGLTIVFDMFTNYFKSLRGFTGLLVFFIFYIPCLLLDFFKYILNEFKMTSNSVLILFLIELILLLIYFYLPNIMEKISIQDGKEILKGYAYLNSSNTFSMEDIMTFENDKLQVADVGEKNIHRNYALSMWVYLNNYSTSMAAYNKETLIFDYGNGKPKVTYFNDENEPGKMDTYRFYFSDKLKDGTAGNENYYEVKIPNQKWNNFVFNYNSKYVDLYINGELKRTFYFKENLPTYSLGDTVTTGSDNGLSGAICNIRYYSRKLTSRDITSMYNLLRKKNPPTNNL